MEYYVYLTHQCNVRCSYCCSHLVVSGGTSDATPEHLERVAEAIARRGDGDLLMFSGGEPFLKPELMERMVDLTEGMGLERASLTNGTLLHRAPDQLLERLDALLVSVDGDRQSHERHRGRGTYDRIISNLRSLRSRPHPPVVARITVEEETDIFRSVSNLAGLTDAVYWQIVSKPRFRDPEGFARRYERRVVELVDFWLEGLRRGALVKIIPFHAIAATMLFGYQRGAPSFRCGAGWGLQVIDLDGTVYWCDEYTGDPKGAVGSIYDGNIDLGYEPHTALFPDCTRCHVAQVCLGRCKKCLKEYEPDHVRVYCRLTRRLIDAIAERLDQIGKAVERLGLDEEAFLDFPSCTEEIP